MDQFPCSGEGKQTPNVLGPFGGGTVNHWTTGTMDNVQKLGDSDFYVDTANEWIMLLSEFHSSMNQLVAAWAFFAPVIRPSAVHNMEQTGVSLFIFLLCGLSPRATAAYRRS
jgi:hypothetical protein